jgi:hypothetical protein
MPTSTNAEALRDMQGLHQTTTGRLLGLSARYLDPRRAITQLGDTPQPWRSRIIADLTARTAGILTADSAEYLVLSDRTVIATLTVAAHLRLPDYPLTGLQRRHQGAVVAALSDLPRHTLRDLADRRSALDGRDEQAALEDDPPATGAVRVAADDEPTVTDWITADADLRITRDAVRRTGLDPDHLIIITAAGYGRYGRDRHRLDLPTLCAMRRVAREHQVSLQVVGDWLDAEGATWVDLDPAQIETGFADAYLGPFDHELDYTRHHVTELGWTAALHQAGIPERYLDERALNRDWFAQQVRSITCSTRHRVEVFRRASAM